MKIKKALFLIFGLAIILYTITYISGYSLIIDLSSRKHIHKVKCLSDSISPLKKFNFESDDSWEAHLVLDFHDVNLLPKDLPRANYLKTTDISVLKNMGNTWNFKCSHGDMATVTSKLLLTKNGTVVFETGIHITNEIQGLQSEDFGWIQSKAILQDVKKFKRSFMPVIFI